MKKNTKYIFVMFLILAGLIFLTRSTLSSVSSSVNSGSQTPLFASVGNCQPTGDYDTCDEYQVGQSKVKIMGYLNFKGDIKTSLRDGKSYYIKNAKFELKLVEGDKLYYGNNIADSWTGFWDMAECDINGCHNPKLSEVSKTYTINVNAGDEFQGCPILLGWDRYENAWTGQTRGWIGTSNKCLGTGNNGIKVVECVDHSDCSDGVCDTSGTWKEWKCLECARDSDCPLGSECGTEIPNKCSEVEPPETEPPETEPPEQTPDKKEDKYDIWLIVGIAIGIMIFLAVLV